jgi:hypothetical protein
VERHRQVVKRGKNAQTNKNASTTNEVIFAAAVGPELCEAVDAAEGRVLVLPSWHKKTAAEFVFKSAGKSATAAATEERKSVLLWRAHKKKKVLWCVFPDQGTTLEETGKGAHVVVRAGLEVVIPHHDVVRALVGAKTFDALKKLAVGKNPDATSALVTSLDNVLGRSQTEESRARNTEKRLPGDELNDIDARIDALTLKETKGSLSDRDKRFLETLYARQDELRTELYARGPAEAFRGGTAMP